MKTKALVVEDDPRDFTAIENALVSLGHEFVWAKNQFDAERALAEHEFDYVLADLTIPARSRRSKPNPEFCLNFLDNLQKRCSGIPVIVLADREAFVPDMVRDLIDLGAVEVVGKPFSAASRRLSMVICKVLRGHGRPPATGAASGIGSVGPLKPFTGGQLVLYPDRAELCEIKIVGDNGFGHSLKVLQGLSRRDRSGRFVHRSAEELAGDLGGTAGIGTVTAAVQTVRRNVACRLQRHLGMACRPDDVIRNDEQGYSLRDWIVLGTSNDANEVVASDRRHDLAVQGQRLDWPAAVTTNGTGDSGDDTAEPRNAPLNERQQWVLHELERGVRLCRNMLERQFDIHSRTAKRDLGDLAERGIVQFVRVGKAGYYQLISESSELACAGASVSESV